MIMKSIIQNQHVRCNFCLEWFVHKNNIKSCLHLCESCLNRAVNTECYKIPSSSGEFLYQVYLVKNHLPLEGPRSNYSTLKNSLLQELEEKRNQQLRQLLNKWSDIENQIQSKQNLTVEQVEQYRYSFPSHSKNNEKLKQYSTKKQVSMKDNFLVDKTQNFLSTNNIKTESMIENKQIENSVYSPLKSLKPKIAVSPSMKPSRFGDLRDHHLGNNSCIYFERQTKMFKSGIQNKENKKQFETKKSQLKKSNISQKSQKISKDLEAIRKDALKSKIYTYLENSPSVPSSLLLVMTLQIYDAIKNTTSMNKCLELVLFNISEISIKCYLEMLDWDDVQVLKLVKVGLTDEQFSDILDFIKQKKIETLVVTSNKLTEASCKELIVHNLPSLKNIYLGRNKILRFKIKQEMKDLEDRYYVYL